MEEGDINAFQIILGVTGGLVVFLIGVEKLAEGMKALAGDKMKSILSRFTTNRFAGVLTGAVTTTVLDSSSITIIMVITMVNAGILTFLQSLGVILGSNIGTTISSQIIAFHVNDYAPIAMLVGFILSYFIKNEKAKQIGSVVLGLGLVFFGLDKMGEPMEPLKDHQPFINLMNRMESPWLGVAVAAGFTVLIQSSSATLGIIITLATQGMISLSAGIALMMGSEIGTCADTLVATIGRSREAVKAGIFHLGFNIVSVVFGVLFISQITGLVKWVSSGADIPRQIANAHVLFNICGVLLFIGFLPLIAKALNLLLPPRTDSIKEDN